MGSSQQWYTGGLCYDTRQDGGESSTWCDDTRSTGDNDWIVQPTDAHLSTLIFLHSCHGRPEHAAGFVEDLREYAALDERHLRVISPAAPRRPIDSEAGGSRQ